MKKKDKRYPDPFEGLRADGTKTNAKLPPRTITLIPRYEIAR